MMLLINLLVINIHLSHAQHSSRKSLPPREPFCTHHIKGFPPLFHRSLLSILLSMCTCSGIARRRHVLDLNLRHALCLSEAEVSLFSLRVLRIVCLTLASHLQHVREYCSQLLIADLIASSASILQCSLTGGRHNSFAISVFLIRPACSSVMPRTSSVRYDEEAIADPHPKVLNFTSAMVLESGLTLI